MALIEYRFIVDNVVGRKWDAFSDGFLKSKDCLERQFVLLKVHGTDDKQRVSRDADLKLDGPFLPELWNPLQPVESILVLTQLIICFD